MEPNATGGIKTWQWVVTVIVIIVLVILGYSIFKGSPVTTTTTVEETPIATVTPKVGDINRIVMNDQFPGPIVYVSSVQLAQPGFVVIHKDNNGTPGAVIGYQYYDKGIYPGKVTVTTPTVEGGTYYVMLHSDNGDKKFDAAKDLPLKDAKGDIIMKPFRVTTTVTEVKG